MEKPTLEGVKQKFLDWQQNNQGEGMIPRRLKREAVALLEIYSKARLAKELGLTESCVRAWQRRILEIEHDAGVDARIYEPAAKRTDEAPAFLEVGASGATPFETGRPALLLRRPDGAVMTVKGELTVPQIKALTSVFLGDPS